MALYATVSNPVFFGRIGMQSLSFWAKMPRQEKKGFLLVASFVAFLLLVLGFFIGWEVRMQKMPVASSTNAPTTEPTVLVPASQGSLVIEMPTNDNRQIKVFLSPSPDNKKEIGQFVLGHLAPGAKTPTFAVIGPWAFSVSEKMREESGPPGIPATKPTSAATSPSGMIYRVYEHRPGEFPTPRPPKN